ncbi:hemin receptor [Paroceanicella profunda]|uniref:Hemin receptor n=1 Tax=Paroceanicella profunda TaxID=2579971 RepID=A0A5B8FVH2_9RHOB|nr:globin family protein [Paroceanicella profunda]QDL91354.1 hemin receptor [Paroceanicella profunda]
MTPDQIALVQDSFSRISADTSAAGDRFYARLFALAPETRELFPGDMSSQKMKLIQMLAIAVNGLTSLPQILPAVQALGLRHAVYEVQEAHYAIVGEALLETLADELGDSFTEETRAAWAEAYALLAGVMIEAQRGALR